MRIAHGRLQIAVPKQLLNCADVAARLQQMRSERVNIQIRGVNADAVVIYRVTQVVYMVARPMSRQYKHDNATLEELEQSNWGEPTYSSHLVKECHRLRRVQLRLLTIENLRILIGQNIGLPFLMPLALERLEQNPLAEGDFYPGDLLCAALRVEADFWGAHAEERARLDGIVEGARKLAALESEIVVRALEDALNQFAITADAG